MSVHSLEQQIADSLALKEVATKAGLTIDQARAFLAALSNLPLVQVVRMGVFVRQRERREDRVVERKATARRRRS